MKNMPSANDNYYTKNMLFDLPLAGNILRSKDLTKLLENIPAINFNSLLLIRKSVFTKSPHNELFHQGLSSLDFLIAKYLMQSNKRILR